MNPKHAFGVVTGISSLVKFELGSFRVRTRTREFPGDRSRAHNAVRVRRQVVVVVVVNIIIFVVFREHYVRLAITVQNELEIAQRRVVVRSRWRVVCDAFSRYHCRERIIHYSFPPPPPPPDRDYYLLLCVRVLVPVIPRHYSPPAIPRRTFGGTVTGRGDSDFVGFRGKRSPMKRNKQ